MASSRSECVRVVVRCRPMSEKENVKNCQRIIDMEGRAGEVYVRNPKDPKEPPKVFTFDRVYNWECHQPDVFNETARPIVDSVFEGYNGTIFAYGQTGAGKTWTMEGDFEDPDLRGLIPNTFEYIFNEINNQSEEKKFLVRVSYLEIYNEEIRDLLSPDQSKAHGLELKENPDHGVYVKDLRMVVVSSFGDMLQVLRAGKKNRKVGATLMNSESSRSHAIFTITVEIAETGGDGEQHFRVGKLNLVDLAGSERIAKTGAEGVRMKEGCRINLSLTALGNVISALVDKKASHIPYRDSKLTRLLQDSLGGNTKTVMFANVGPADYNYDETMSTLRYANRAKQIQNKPRINEDPKDAMLRDLQEQIKMLEIRLAAQAGLSPADLAAAMAAGVMPALEPESKVVVRERIVQGISPEELEAMRNKTEEEKMRILQEKGLAEEERLRALEEVQRMQETYEVERRQNEELQRQLESMMAMVQSGGQLASIAREQEEELRRVQAEIEQRRTEEERLRRELEEQEVERMNIEESFNTLQEKGESLERKLKLVLSKYRKLKQERTDLADEFNRDREEMLETIREREKELMLKDIVIDNFIPPEEVQRIEERAEWDETGGQWRLRLVQFAGNNVRVKRPGTAAGSRRPNGDFKAAAAAAADPRYRGEDILGLGLDMGGASMYDYENMVGDSSDDMYFRQAAGMPNVYFSYKPSESESRPKSSRKRSSQSRKSKRVDVVVPGDSVSPGVGSSSDDFPAARGLVTSNKHLV